MRTLLALMLLCWQASAAATTWYVNAAMADDTGAGTAVSTAFKTIAAAIRTNAAAGDTVWIAPGVYREALTLNRHGLTVNGDPLNTRGFSGITAGTIRWTGHTTDDKTAASASPMTTSTYTNYVWQDIWFDGGAQNAVSYNSGAYWHTFTRCLMTTYGANKASFYANPASNIPIRASLDRCILISQGTAGVYAYPSSNPTSDLNLELAVYNCLIYGISFGVRCSALAGGAYASGGVCITNCTIIGATVVSITSTNSIPSVPNVIWRCALYGSTGISCGALASVYTVTNGYNAYFVSTARSGASIAAGPGEQTSYAMLNEFGQTPLWFNRGGIPWMPTKTSPALAFCDDVAAGTGGTDLLGRVRPSGPGVTWGSGYATNATGALEYHDFGVRDATSTNVDDGTYSIKLTGPGDHQISVPVNATATVLTVRVKRDSTYAGTNPKVQRVAQPELISGDTGETLTSAGAANAFETLTFSSFTPTEKGAVILRLISSDTAGNGLCWFDTVARNY